MTPEVTKTVLNKIILNVWIENGPVLQYGTGIELAFRSNSYVYHFDVLKFIFARNPFMSLQRNKSYIFPRDTSFI
jgi:hypothetical protein